MIADPALMPVIVQDGELVEPMVILLLVVLQAPPVVPFVSMIVAPWHTDAGPPIAVGAVLTVTVSLTEQPGSEPVEPMV